MNKEYWIQVFVDYTRNVDFINDIANNRGYTLEVKSYRDGKFEYVVYHDEEESLRDLTYDYEGENYSFESHNLSIELN